MDPITAAAIAGGNQAVGGFFGYLGQRRQNKHNLRLAQDARDHDVNMWNLQNQYNTPQMQMQRMKEAGLNPNLMYGQGNTGNAAPAPKAPVPEVGDELAGLAQMSTLPALSLYQDFKVKNAQIDNIEAQAEATRQNAALTALRSVSQDYLNKKYKEESFYYNQDAQNKAAQRSHISNYWQQKYQKERISLTQHLPQQIQSTILRNSLLNQQITGQRLENDLNEKLKPFGASSRDPLLQRLIMMFMSPKPGSKAPNILTDPFGHLKYSIKHPFGK